jgi:hypothetical protein
MMNLHTTHRTCTRTVLATLAAVSAVSLAACGGGGGADDASMPTFTSTPPTTSSLGPQVGAGDGLADTAYVDLDGEVFGGTDTNDPQSVLVDGLTESFAWRPAEDSNGFAAIRRGHTAWNNDYLRAQEARLTTLVPMSSRDWQTWGDHGQVFTAAVSVTNEEHPADTATDFSRVVKIVLSTTGGTRPELNREIETLIAPVRMHKADPGWRIDSFTRIDTIMPDRSGATTPSGGSTATDTAAPSASPTGAPEATS